MLHSEPLRAVHRNAMIHVLKTKLSPVVLIQPEVFRDARGENFEVYNDGVYKENGIPINFVQDNVSVSKRHVLRGIHGDVKTYKLVTCLYGELCVVVVNCDPASKDFGMWESFRLSDKNKLQVLIPPKFGNAHLVLSDKAVFYYKWSEYFKPYGQFSYRWDDPRFGITWPIKRPILSERDALGRYPNRK